MHLLVSAGRLVRNRRFCPTGRWCGPRRAEVRLAGLGAPQSLSGRRDCGGAGRTTGRVSRPTARTAGPHAAPDSVCLWCPRTAFGFVLKICFLDPSAFGGGASMGEGNTDWLPRLRPGRGTCPLGALGSEPAAFRCTRGRSGDCATGRARAAFLTSSSRLDKLGRWSPDHI